MSCQSIFVSCQVRLYPSLGSHLTMMLMGKLSNICPVMSRFILSVGHSLIGVCDVCSKFNLSFFIFE